VDRAGARALAVAPRARSEHSRGARARLAGASELGLRRHLVASRLGSRDCALVLWLLIELLERRQLLGAQLKVPERHVLREVL